MNSSVFRRFVAVSLTLILATPASAFDKYGGGPIVAELVGRLLEQTHYARRPIDDAVSKEFLRNTSIPTITTHDRGKTTWTSSRPRTTLDDRIRTTTSSTYGRRVTSPRGASLT